MDGTVISCDNGVIRRFGGRTGRRVRSSGGESDREMGKGRTRMNEVSVYMDACVRVWGKGRRGSWLVNFCVWIEFSEIPR